MIAVDILSNAKQNLLSEMSRQGISQAELARRAGVRQATISDVLRGEYDPSVRMCERLATALGLRPDLIFLEPVRHAS